MRVAVRLIDFMLRKSQHIYEFSEDPECILRLQLKQSTYSVAFEDKQIKKGELILCLHAWNERMPMLPEQGPTVEWALRLRRLVIHSFTQVAALMKFNPRYAQVQAVCGTSALFSFTDHTGGTRLMHHLGFAVLPYHRPFGKFGEFWENLFSWWLMWTYNTASMRSRDLWRLQRTDIWMTRDEFIRRYGANT